VHRVVLPEQGSCNARSTIAAATLKRVQLRGVVCGLLLQAAAALGTSRVAAVHDGDSLAVTAAHGQRLEVRLAGIDSPEHGQPWGNESRAALEELVAGKRVRLQRQDVDRYGRTVARVFVGRLDVNEELVRRGEAWVYRRYAKDGRLLALEREARAAHRGLWSLPAADRVPPWKWRKSHPRRGP
jgi:endonuclease YncB( thermonuclease family)